MMLSCTALEAMKIWGELIECFHGVNRYDDNIAEIYSFRFEPYVPGVHLNLKDDDPTIFTSGRIKEVARNAILSLIEIVEAFCETFECKAKIENETLPSWKKRLTKTSFTNGVEKFGNKYHVEIIRK